MEEGALEREKFKLTYNVCFGVASQGILLGIRSSTVEQVGSERSVSFLREHKLTYFMVAVVLDLDHIVPCAVLFMI